MSYNGLARLRPVNYNGLAGLSPAALYTNENQGGWIWRLREDKKKLWHRLWWKHAEGPTVTVKLPDEDVSTYEYDDYMLHKDDVFFFYKPWLEQEVGKQGWDWDWEAEFETVTSTTQFSAMFNYIAESSTPTSVTIKLRKSKEKYASMIALKWG